MGNWFDTLFNVLKQDKECTRKEADWKKDKNGIPIKLVKPSEGRIVELKVTETDEKFAEIYMSHLMQFAEVYEQFGARWKVIKGNTIRIEFTDGDTAEIVRQQF